MFHSNLDQFGARVEALSDAIRTDEGLGRDLADAHAIMLMDRNTMQQNPDGSQWPENQPEYAARKGYLPVGILTGDTLAPKAIMGDVAIEERSVTIAYAGGPAEVAKLNWLAASGRLAWGLDDNMRSRFHDMIKEHLKANLVK